MFSKFGLQYRYQSMESLGKSFRKTFNEQLQGFDVNTLGNVEGVKYKKHTYRVKANRRVTNEYTMATIMVLATGHHWVRENKRNGERYVDPLAVLRKLQRIPDNQIQVID